MRRLKVRSDGAEPNRFSDMSGYVIDPGEPPTWADAMSNEWAKFWYAAPGAEKKIPDKTSIDAELERLQALDELGLWDRDNRVEIAG